MLGRFVPSCIGMVLELISITNGMTSKIVWTSSKIHAGFEKDWVSYIDVPFNQTEKMLPIGRARSKTSALSDRFSVTRRTIERALRCLIDKGLLEKRGTKDSPHWVVIK